MTMRFYWDIFFFVNVIMNLFLLGMTAIFRRKHIVAGRMLAAAVLGSGEMTAAVVWGLRRKQSYPAWEAVDRAEIVFWGMMAFCIALEMLQITFRERSGKEMFRDFFCLLRGSLLTGGVLYVMRERLEGGAKVHVWLLLAGSFGVFVMIWFWKRMMYREEQAHVMDGIIVMDTGQRVLVRVLADTGNQLISPYSGERVMVLAQEIADMLALEKQQNPLMIPYHSIGGAGVLPAYRIPLLRLQDGSELRDFLAAVSSEISRDSAAQLIMYSGSENDAETMPRKNMH